MLNEEQINKLDKKYGVKKCWACGSQKKLEQHHIIPKRSDGKGKRNNKLLLCHNCHKIADKISYKIYGLDIGE